MKSVRPLRAILSAETFLHLRFRFWLVARFFASGRRWISLPSAVSLLGLAVAVACMTLAMGVVSGFENTLRSAVIDVFGHLLVVRKLDRTTSVEAAMSKIRELAPEVVSYTPFLQLEGVMAKNGKLSGIIVQGLEPQTVDQVLQLRKRVISGNFSFSQDPLQPSAMIGKGLAKRFSVSIGDSIQVVLPSPTVGSASDFKPRSKVFKVVGILDLGKFEYDERYVVTDLKSAQKLANIGEGFSGIRMLLTRPELATEVSIRLRRALGNQYFLMDWVDVNKNLFEAVAFERLVIFFVLLVIVVAAAFNVSSNLFVSVLTRYADMSILKAMGFSQSDVLWTFAIQGLFFGCVGTLMGLIAGFALCFSFDFVQRFIVLLPSDVYKIGRLATNLRWMDLFAIVVASLGICLLASVAPALRGSKLNPVEGLRYE